MKKTLLALACLAGHAGAADLFFKTVHPDYDTPPVLEDIYARCGVYCPDLRIAYVQSNRDAINQAMNADINAFLREALEVEGQLPGNAVPDKAAFTAAIAQFAQTKLKSVQETFGDKEVDSLAYSHEVVLEPQYLGHYKNIEQFGLSTYQYAGGAHGVSGQHYYLFNEQNARLTLADILESGQEEALKTLLHKQFGDYLAAQGLERDAEDEKTFPFMVSKDFLFTQEGLSFQYQPYEIAAYAVGMPELTVAYKDLQGIVKKDYLP